MFGKSSTYAKHLVLSYVTKTVVKESNLGSSHIRCHYSVTHHVVTKKTKQKQKQKQQTNKKNKCALEFTGYIALLHLVHKKPGYYSCTKAT